MSARLGIKRTILASGIRRLKIPAAAVVSTWQREEVIENLTAAEIVEMAFKARETVTN
jgi:hypothetical protein